MYFYSNQSAVTVWKKNTSDTDSTDYNYVKHSVSSLLFLKNNLYSAGKRTKLAVRQTLTEVTWLLGK